MPNLLGFTQAEAEKRVLAAGLRYVYYLENNEETKGLVFKQEPKSGASIAKGDNISFWVSKGK